MNKDGSTPWDEEEIIDDLVKSTGYGDPFSEECKWYDHDEDMRRFSKLHPDLVFTLMGEGENNEDIWKAVYVNGKGKRVKARIVFEEISLLSLT